MGGNVSCMTGVWPSTQNMIAVLVLLVLWWASLWLVRLVVRRKIIFPFRTILSTTTLHGFLVLAGILARHAFPAGGRDFFSFVFPAVLGPLLARRTQAVATNPVATKSPIPGRIF